MIHIDFNDFNEMVSFAEQLLGKTAVAGAAVQEGKPVHGTVPAHLVASPKPFHPRLYSSRLPQQYRRLPFLIRRMTWRRQPCR